MAERTVRLELGVTVRGDDRRIAEASVLLQSLGVHLGSDVSLNGDEIENEALLPSPSYATTQ